MHSPLSCRDAPPGRPFEITGDGGKKTGPASLVDLAPPTSGDRPLAPSPSPTRGRIVVPVSKIDRREVTLCNSMWIETYATVSSKAARIVIAEL